VHLTEPETTTAGAHDIIDPAILYLGTPVVLMSSENPDGTTNLAPMSSAWWLGNRGVLGLASRSQTTRNILRTGECVLNLPSADLVDAVDRLALTTGADPMSDFKKANGYRYEPDKFGTAGLTPAPSIAVRPDRVAECRSTSRPRSWPRIPSATMTRGPAGAPSRSRSGSRPCTCTPGSGSPGKPTASIPTCGGPSS
jgi:flavin reductase (DIM6/NTAB) family NADH-FMN oxidoreductase RutF